jgi:DNA topoisomerase I
LLSLPREVGLDPESGDIITAQNGRYGPYLKKGTDTRSLDSEEKIFEIDVEGALARFAEPKYQGRRQAQALQTFEPDPVSGKPILLKDGRFGPYVTDGEINATVPAGCPWKNSILTPCAADCRQTSERPGAQKTSAKKTTAKKKAKKPAPRKRRQCEKNNRPPKRVTPQSVKITEVDS